MAVYGAAILLVLVPPLLHLPYLAGDTVIHFVFAENAAAGHLFQFNRGAVSGGETSPGYMLVVAALQLILGVGEAAYAVKLLSLASWLSHLALLWLLGRRLFNARLALLATVVAAAFPGSVQNATLGMENVHFATLSLLWLCAALSFGWLDAEPMRLGPAGVLGFSAGLTAWLRPEAIPFFMVAGLLRLTASRRTFQDVIAFGAGFSIPVAALVVFFVSYTETWPWSAGIARANLSAARGWSLGPMSLQHKTAVRLAAYLPLSLLFVTGLIAWRRESDSPRRRLLTFCAAQTIAFFLLFSTVLTDVHLSRYTIFVWSLFSLVAALGIELGAGVWPTLASRWRPLVIALLAIQGGIFFAETVVRLNRSRGHRIARIVEGPTHRRPHTDDLLRRLGEEGGGPIIVATVEVDHRFFWDERITVRSLDGIVDRHLADFYEGGNYDHIGYLRSRRVDYLLAYPNFNRDKEQWSLERLRKLGERDSVIRGGLRFTRLASGATRVERAARRAPVREPSVP